MGTGREGMPLDCAVSQSGLKLPAFFLTCLFPNTFCPPACLPSSPKSSLHGVALPLEGPGREAGNSRNQVPGTEVNFFLKGWGPPPSAA